MLVGKVIYNILSNNGNVSGVTTNIKPVFFPDPNKAQDPELVTPSIVYEVTNTDTTDVKGQVSPVDVYQVLVTTLHDDYSSATSLADFVRTALDHVSGTYNSIEVDSIFFIDSDDNIIQKTHKGQSAIFVIEQLYRVRVKR